MKFDMIDADQGVGIFVISDRFDLFVRDLSEEYLCVFEKKVFNLISCANMNVDNVNWGWGHPGYTDIELIDSPISYFGLVINEPLSLSQEELIKSKLLPPDNSYSDIRFGVVESRGKILARSIGCYSPLLLIISEFCIDDWEEWEPRVWVSRNGSINNELLSVFRALIAEDLSELAVAVEGLNRYCSNFGFLIVIQGLLKWSDSNISKWDEGACFLRKELHTQLAKCSTHSETGTPRKNSP